MALTMEGFSIREYAARMRSVDVEKCWPFDVTDEEDSRAVLPPMTIKKFRWWFDELELVDDDEDNNKVEEEESESDSDLDRITLESFRRMKRVQKLKNAKPKVKAPKKRSIVELFAVAPPVEILTSDDDDENGEYSDDDDEDGSMRKVNKKGAASMLQKEKSVMIKNLKNKEGVKNNKKMEKGKKVAKDLICTKKDKTSKLKLQTSANSIVNGKFSTYSKDLFEAIATHSKKPRLKRLAKEKMKCKNPSTSKLLQDDDHAVPLVCGILRNMRKVVPAENSKDSILCDADRFTQHINKHVSFSRSDGVLELKRKVYPTVELGMQTFIDSSDTSATSLEKSHISEVEKSHISEVDKSLSIQEMKETELRISGATAGVVEVQRMTENQLFSRYHIADAPNLFMSQHGFNQRNWLSSSLSFGQRPLHVGSPQWFEECNRLTARDALYAHSSGIPSMSQHCYNPKFAVPMFGYTSYASSSSHELLDLPRDAGPEFGSGCSVDCLKAYPQPLSSYFSILGENTNTRPLFSSHSIRENNNDHAFPCQWLPHLSPKELMRTIYSLPEWNSRVPMYGEAGVNDDFSGLPLNSQGEFISLNSSGKDSFDHHLKSMSRDPSLTLPMHENILANSITKHLDIRRWHGMAAIRDQLQACGIRDTGKGIADSALPPGIDMIEEYCIGRTNTVLKGSDSHLYSVDTDMELMKESHFEPRCKYDVHKHPRDDIIQQHANPDRIPLHVTQSTMRLMGQEFTVGGKGLEGLNARELWTDKQVITNHSSNNGIEASSINSQNMPKFVVHPILGKLKESVAYVSKAEMKQVSEVASPMMVPEYKTSLDISDGQNNLMQQNLDGISNGVLLPEKHPKFSLVSSPLSVSDRSTLQNQLSCPNISPIDQPQISISTPTLLDYNENMSRSRLQLENKHKPVHAAELAFRYPFSHLEHGMHTHPSLSENSFKVTHPRFLETGKRGPLIGYHQSHSGPGTVYRPCPMSGINFPTEPSSFPRPEPFLLFPSSGSENAFASTSLVRHPSVPIHPGFLPNSSVQNKLGEKVKIGNESAFSVRIPSHGKRSKKRVPSVSNDIVRSPKVPKVGDIQEDSSCAVTADNNFQRESESCDGRVLELGSGEAIADAVECGHYGIHAEELRDFTEMGFVKLTGAPRSGPVKLTAGARYILKPCQNDDQANSKSTNSTIPDVAPITDSRFLGSEKSSKIYRF